MHFQQIRFENLYVLKMTFKVQCLCSYSIIILFDTVEINFFGILVLELCHVVMV